MCSYQESGAETWSLFSKNFQSTYQTDIHKHILQYAVDRKFMT